MGCYAGGLSWTLGICKFRSTELKNDMREI